SRRVAKWTGDVWEGYGEGLWSTINDICVDKKGTIFAGGPGGIVTWNGEKWVRFGTCKGYGRIDAVECDEAGHVFVGGIFDSISESYIKNFAIWDNSNWTIPFQIMDKRISVFASDNNGNLYAGGDFTVAGGI